VISRRGYEIVTYDRSFKVERTPRLTRFLGLLELSHVLLDLD
jgi:hypothetical protein